ncbi:hypothetical protein MesoLjLc_51740 [Mesorhizobium sp. L-8-10]|nr:hypothetical protein MesoLjLc_51740 [Mesorhizobium sp. L-8-10]
MRNPFDFPEMELTERAVRVAMKGILIAVVFWLVFLMCALGTGLWILGRSLSVW